MVLVCCLPGLTIVCADLDPLNTASMVQRHSGNHQSLAPRVLARLGKTDLCLSIPDGFLLNLANE